MLGVLVRRGADFAAAEDAVQEALLEAVRRWPDDPPADPKAWLVTVAWRKYVDGYRSDSARRAREERVVDEPPPGPTEQADDTLQLLFLCCHPSLTPASAVALTLRAVGGLTTRAGGGGLPGARRRRWRSGSAGPSGRSRRRGWRDRATSATC